MSPSNRSQQIKTLEKCVRELKLGTLDDKKCAKLLRKIAKYLDPKQPMQPTQDQLKKAWKHLTNEVQAINQQGSEYVRLKKLKEDKKKLPASVPPLRVINGLLDAFCVHARELDEFLYLSGRGDKDTMLGEDFVSRWPKSRPESPLQKKALKPLIGKVSLRDEINWMIVHLCYRRIDVYDVQSKVANRWPVEQTMEDMCVPLEAFAKAVASNPDAKKFCEQVEQLCEAVRQLSKTHPQGFRR